jgi:hypothetical protein
MRSKLRGLDSLRNSRFNLEEQCRPEGPTINSHAREGVEEGTSKLNPPITS